MKDYTQYPKKFVAYEVNRISCDFESEQDFLETLEELKQEGLDSSKFYILNGPSGIKAFDPTGVEHGVWSMISRKVHRIVSEAEEKAIDDLWHDLEKGMIHLSIPAKKTMLRKRIHRIMDNHHGCNAKYTDRFFVETYASA